MVTIERIVTGKWAENCFIVHDDAGHAVAIDPGDDAPVILAYLKRHHLSLNAILNTHAHFDHVGAVAELKAACGAKFYLHAGDRKLLAQANFYRSFFLKESPISTPEMDFDLAQYETVTCGSMVFTVLPCPGHTPGGVSFQLEAALFCGDTLLNEKIGRTDLPGGDRSALQESVRRLSCLPKSMLVYPGHGEVLSLGDILTSNSEIAEFVGAATDKLPHFASTWAAPADWKEAK